MENKSIGVIGASSFVGQNILPLLEKSDWNVVAFTRQQNKKNVNNIEWRQLYSVVHMPKDGEIIPFWICAAPIWVMHEYFDLLKAHKVKRIVVLSSTSRFTKEDSSDFAEQAIALKLAENEERLQTWAEEQGIEWVILRPTMIYGQGKDKNVAEIARLIQRWGFFPILGKGRGLRQPVHVEDVAKACEAAITVPVIKNKAYNLSGDETLSYKEMVSRIFIALDKKPHFVHFPRWVFGLSLLGLRFLPRFKKWTVAMADRMDRDLVFEHKDATTNLGFTPRTFQLDGSKK